MKNGGDSDGAPCVPLTRSGDLYIIWIEIASFYLPNVTASACLQIPHYERWILCVKIFVLSGSCDAAQHNGHACRRC